MSNVSPDPMLTINLFLLLPEFIAVQLSRLFMPVAKQGTITALDNCRRSPVLHIT